jgi:ABC-2 type transport system ATP-binding protein
MDEAVRCHRLALLRDGARVALGRPSELMHPLATRVVDVDAVDPEAALAVLKNAAFVASTTRLGDTVHVLLARASPPAWQAARAIVDLLAGAGISDARVAASQPTLEDVFVAILLGERLLTNGGGA